jgi:hypothetical protein
MRPQRVAVARIKRVCSCEESQDEKAQNDLVKSSSQDHQGEAAAAGYFSAIPKQTKRSFPTRTSGVEQRTFHEYTSNRLEANSFCPAQFGGPMKFGAFLVCVTIGVGLLGGATGVRAQDRDECSDHTRRDRRDLARAIDGHGYYSSQARHERAELQRDAARCGYSDYDRDDWWRDDRGRYRDRQYDKYGERGYKGPALDIGYRDGVAVGQRDWQRGRPVRPDKNDYYEDADHGYQKSYGDKGFYKSEYREAFQRGYADGYGYRR